MLMMVCIYLDVNVVSDCKYSYTIHNHISHCITLEILAMHLIYHQYSPAMVCLPDGQDINLVSLRSSTFVSDRNIKFRCISWSYIWEALLVG